ICGAHEVCAVPVTTRKRPTFTVESLRRYPSASDRVREKTVRYRVTGKVISCLAARIARLPPLSNINRARGRVQSERLLRRSASAGETGETVVGKARSKHLECAIDWGPNQRIPSGTAAKPHQSLSVRPQSLFYAIALLTTGKAGASMYGGSLSVRR